MDLTRFCSLDPERGNISAPFSVGDYTYATNGHILVRVPRREDVTRADDDCERLIRQLTFDHDSIADWHLPPTYAMPETHPCGTCSGIGKVEPCAECGGDGEVEFSNHYSDYTVECNTCNGRGIVPGNGRKCMNCYGSGQYIYERDLSVEVADGVVASVVYLEWIKGLEGLEFAVRGLDPIRFRWDGGVGLLMPRKRPE